MKPIKIIIFSFTFLYLINLSAQVGINSSGNGPDQSAMLDVKSTDKGFLPPCMSEEQMMNIHEPADGLMVYCLDCVPRKLKVFNGSYWCNGDGFPDPGFEEVFNPATGKIWLDRNLGASQVATSSNDAAAYGDLYQWGRANDGHENRASVSIATYAMTPVPNGGNPWDGLFITIDVVNPFDWLNPQNHSLWQGVSGINNVCPEGFRLPTKAEWDEERLSWISNDAAGAFASPLKLTIAGWRDLGNAALWDVGIKGQYWSSTVFGLGAWMLGFQSDNADSNSLGRAYGLSVRCIKNSNNLNRPPVASNVSFSGILAKDELLNGSYVYSDHENDVEDISTYVWFRADDENGNNRVLISGANSPTYTLVAADEEKYIAFEVRPYAQTGTSPGFAVHSPYQGPVIPTVSSATGEIWMDRNLGASQVATSSNDAAAYGNLYQWGRANEGHESRTSGTIHTYATTSLPDNGNPWDGLFITIDVITPFDWLTPQEPSLWQGINGGNNVCPVGFRLPTHTEWDEERLSWSSNDAAGAFASPLKLTVAGWRDLGNGVFWDVGVEGQYWSGTVFGLGAWMLGFQSDDAGSNSLGRAYGLSVRCIKD